MTNSGKRILAILSIGAAAVIATTAVRAAEQKVAIDELPDAVRKALNEAVGDGTIGEIEREDEDGQVVYEAEATIDGKKVELEFSATGELLETETAEDDDHGDDDGDSEETIALDALPAAVQTTLSNEIPGVKVDEVTREVEGGHAYYEVEYEADGADHSIKLTDAGDIVEIESGVAASALPAGVATFLQSRYEGATVEEAQFVTAQFYEVELKTARGNIELKVFANGARLDDDDD